MGPGFLDQPLPRAWRVALVVFMAALPTLFIIKIEREHGLNWLMCYGQYFAAKSMPEVQKLHPVSDPVYGYDGQFYSQIALDPMLRRPELKQALDSAGFRCQRIFLPALAYVLGLGRPTWILAAYALLNLVFWFVLLAGLLHFLRAATFRQFAVIAAILFSTGCLISVMRALTDLPMSVLGYFAAELAGWPAAILLACAFLTKPTGGLMLIRHAWPIPSGWREIGRRALFISVAVVPAMLWFVYVRQQVGMESIAGDNIGWPLLGFVSHLSSAFGAFIAQPFQLGLKSVSPWERAFWEFLAPISLIVQAVYLFVRPVPSSRLWWMGIVFALLFLCGTPTMMVQVIGFARTVLPMTIVFNILALREKASMHTLLFLLGNGGLFLAAHEMLGVYLSS